MELARDAFKAEITRAKKVLEEQILPRVETAAEKAADFLGRAGVNASKDPARSDTWQDRTGNLRRSIEHLVLRPGGLRVTDIQVVVYAGMEYAPHVHYREGYRVLVFPPEEARAKVRDLLKIKMGMGS